MRYFEDYKVGDTTETGSYKVTREEIINFASHYDPQPFHLDDELAKDSIFGGLAASGWHTAAIYMRLIVTSFINNSASEGSPGIEELRWLIPVRPDDVLTARFTVLETRPSKSKPQIGIIKGKGEMLNQKGEVVMSLVSNGFFRRKPQDQ